MAPTGVHIQEQIRSYIVENLLFGSSSFEDDSFLEHGGVDSTGVLELVLFVKQTFVITVDDEEILLDNFDSVSSLAGYVTRKQGCSDETGREEPGAP